MRIRPILFNGEMVRAILDGRKTCTRRVVKPQWYACEKCMHIHNEFLYDSKSNAVYCARCGEPLKPVRKPPYQPGDILYVRETWERFECWNCEGDERGTCPKELQKSVLDKHSCGCYMYRATDEISGDAKWHPSIHMPKEAARIWLQVTDVRVERLQDITAEQVVKEGTTGLTMNLIQSSDELKRHYDIPFAVLWDSTIKKADRNLYGWAANPWVWVIEFERCEKPEDK